MNIDDYRAMKAQEEVDSKEEQPTNQGAEVDVPQTTNQEEIHTPPAEEPKVDEPQKITIGGKEYTPQDIEELEKGYLRTQDYTKKTQSLAERQRDLDQAMRLFEDVQKNPELAKQISQTTGNQEADPFVQRISQLETTILDMKVGNEIDRLKGKYNDFDVKGVLELASDKRIANLEDAYLLYKSINNTGTSNQKSEEELREEIKKQLLAEIKQEQDTGSIISTNTNNTPAPRDNTPTLSQQEIKVAKGMGLSPQEYAKWRDATK